MTKKVQFDCVQQAGAYETQSIKFRIQRPTAFRLVERLPNTRLCIEVVPLESCSRLSRHWLEREFLFPCRTEISPAGNVPAPQRRIIKRLAKHGRWINKPAYSKRRHALIAQTASNVVCHARVRATASDWLRCAQDTKNAYGSSQTTTIQADNKSYNRFVVSAPAEPNNNRFNP